MTGKMSRTTMGKFLDEAPGWLCSLLQSATKYVGIDWGDDYDELDAKTSDKRKEYDALAGAEVVSSRVDDGASHYVMLDIDIPAALVPSSRAGHSHLYLCRALDWEEYEKLLRVLAEVGIIEQGYADASIARKQTFLRLPWIRKGTERDDARSALMEWLDEPEPGPELLPF